MADVAYRDPIFIASDYQENFKDVVAKRSGLLQRDGGRLGPSLNNTTQYAGLVLGYATSGGDAGYWKAYNDNNSDGSQVARGVLEQTCSIDANGNGSEISIIKQGTLFQDQLIGLDAAGIVDLSGHATVEHGVNLITIYA